MLKQFVYPLWIFVFVVLSCKKTDTTFIPEVGLVPIVVYSHQETDTIKQDTSLLIQWTNKTSYQNKIEYALDLQENANEFVRLAKISDSGLRLTSLLPSKQYTLKITSIRGQDKISQPVVLHKIITQQIPFYLLSVADSSTKVVLDTMLRWQTVQPFYKKRKVVYDLFIGKSPTFSKGDTIFKNLVDTTFITDKTIITYSKRYFWSVTARYVNDGSECAVCANPSSFVTQDPPSFSYKPILDYIQGSPNNYSATPVYINGVPSVYSIVSENGLEPSGNITINPITGVLTYDTHTPIGTYRLILHNIKAPTDVVYILVVRKLLFAYELNGGLFSAFPKVYSLDFNTATDAPSEIPQRSGYTFDGWHNDDKTFSNRYDFSTLLTDDKTIYAKWKVNVTFALNGAPSSQQPPPQILEINTKATRPPNPVWAGYTFDVWSNNGTTFDFNQLISTPTTLSAKWIQNYFFYSPASGNYVTTPTGENNSGMPTFRFNEPGTYGLESAPFGVSIETRTGIIYWSGTIGAGTYNLRITNTNCLSPVFFPLTVTAENLSCGSNHRELLTELYNSLNGNSWINKNNWNSSEGLGRWAGIATDVNDCVTTINLDRNNVSGSIPASIGNISTLTIIDLHNNAIVGTIPDAINNLSKLAYLDISDNQIGGNIPTALSGLSVLKKMYLQNNRLVGSIPVSIGDLSRLTDLNLSANSLSGTIPSSIGRLTALVDFNASYNSLAGNIPSSISALTELVALDLSNNFLTGTIPAINTLTKLERLWLRRNQLSGTIPDVGNLTQLKTILLNNNSLTGSIPASITNCTALNTIDFSVNQLSGNIPDIPAGKWQNLTTINVSNNKLDGAIPTSIGYISNLASLVLDTNKIPNAIPTSIGTLRWLSTLKLGFNLLTGTIPTTIRNPSNLSYLSLNNNALTGTVPEEIGGLTNLYGLLLNNNKLTGTMPTSICDRKAYGLYGTYNTDNNGNGTILFTPCP